MQNEAGSETLVETCNTAAICGPLDGIPLPGITVGVLGDVTVVRTDVGVQVFYSKP